MLNLRRGVEIEKNDKIKWNQFYKIIKISSNELYITHGLRSVFSFSVVDKHGLGILDKVAELLLSFVSLEELIEKLKISEKDELYLIDLLNSLYEKGVIQKDKEVLNSCYSVYYSGLRKQFASEIGVIGTGPLALKNIFSLLPLELEKINFINHKRKINKNEERLFPIFLKNCLDPNDYINSIRKFLDENGLEDKIKIFSEINSEIILEVFKSSDFVIVSYENYFPRIFYEINVLSHEARKPVLYTFIDGGLGIVGPVVVPGETACFTCFANAIEASVLHPSYFTTYKSYADKKENIPDTPLNGAPPFYDVISGFTIDFLIRFFADPTSVPVMNRVLLLNFESLEMDIQDVLKNPNCPICSKLEPPYMGQIII
jgi:thiazole/oxazole-forming peptide maturase SagC family component